MKKNWVSLFSQTGSEICALSEQLGRTPDFIITNNIGDPSELHPDLLNGLGVIIMKARHEHLMEYLRDGNTFDPKNTVFTLHGYLRIIPEAVCSKYEMYNGHPGLITEYPELKGKDPQQKVLNYIGKYPIIGSVVHKVTPGVDEGEIVAVESVANDCKTSNEVYSKLRETSLKSWVKFMDNYFGDSV